MFDEFANQARTDFQRARFKAFMNRMWATLSGRPTTLLSYDDIKEKLHIGGPIYRGVQTVRVDQIAGSLNRYHEFDRAFLPASDQLAERWQSVNRAFYQEISLPPVVLYKVGQVYFVVDGHHRVSVAREHGQLFISVLDHQQYLAEEGEPLQPPEDAARTFLVNETKKNIAHQKEKVKSQTSNIGEKMISTHSLAGVYAAAVTPLRAASLNGNNSDSTLDLESVSVWLEFLASRGCHGAVLFGTTGEGPSFSPSEREALMRAACKTRDQLPGFRLIAGIGTPSLSETIDLTRLAFDLGYEAALALPPYYFRNATDEGLFNWFSELIRKAVPSDQFLLGYHFPRVAGIGFSIELLARLKDAFPVQFAGIKDSSHDADLTRNLGEKFGSDLVVLTGTDSYVQFAMQNKAAGCITAPANIISPELRKVWDLITEGKDASAAQAHVTEIREILDKYPPFPPTLKAMLHRLHGLPRWRVKPPLVEMTQAMEEQLVNELSGIKERSISVK